MQTDSLLNTDIYQVNYGYNFISKEKWALGVSLGLHVIDFETHINATGKIENNINQNQVKAISRNERTLTVPLPNIGLFTDYHFSKNWALMAHIQYLHIVTDYLEGGMIDTRLAVKYQITQNLSAVGAINYDHITFSEDYQNRNYSLSYSYIGPLVLLEYGF